MVNLLKKNMLFFSTRAAFLTFHLFHQLQSFVKTLFGERWELIEGTPLTNGCTKKIESNCKPQDLQTLWLHSWEGRSSSFSKNQLRFKQPYQTASHSRSRGREANQSQQQVSRLLGAGSFFAFKIGELSEVVKQKKHFSSNKKSSKFQVPDFCEVHHLGTKVSSWAL